MKCRPIKSAKNMGCCCSSEQTESVILSATGVATTDAIPYTPNPDEIPVRVYRDDDRIDTRNKNNK